ncbi:hypothetical protein [Anaerovibrio sp. RM50]|uniref:hypothetical protein n=1 Tax=Anaerovibrio sp. RM50 TaxID=1200557 RepID=UPI0012EBFBE9|nr:hypothetical protein [Anaerovibrio sp. RM50]
MRDLFNDLQQGLQEAVDYEKGTGSAKEKLCEIDQPMSQKLKKQDSIHGEIGGESYGDN